MFPYSIVADLAAQSDGALTRTRCMSYTDSQNFCKRGHSFARWLSVPASMSP